MARNRSKVVIGGLAAALAAAAGVSAVGSAPRATVPSAGDTAFVLAGRYVTGLADIKEEKVSGEVAAIDRKRLYVTNASDVSLDIVDVSAIATPKRLKRVKLSAYGAEATGVAVRGELVAVAVEDGAKPGKVVFLDRKGAVHGAVEVGAGPDMVVFTTGPGGAPRLLVANEGEPTAYGKGGVDPEGSVTVIDVRNPGGKPEFSARTAGFTAFDGEAAALRAKGVRIFGPGASVAQDLEPEYIAVAPDRTKAYVSLQENNAVGVLDLTGEPRFTGIVPLGWKDHSKAGAGMDASDKDDQVNIETWPVKGMYQPDALAAYTAGGKTYLVSANEGDARDYDGFAEEEAAGKAADRTALPATADDARLGRLTVTTAFPASGAKGQKELYSFGARSFSIWDAEAGKLVWDSGDRLERLTAHLLPDHFNTTNDENAFDARSDAKGPEPEAAAVGTIGDRTYAFIGLERTGGVVVADVTDPAAPRITQYLLTRDFSGDEVGPDSGPEVIQFVNGSASPTGGPVLIVSNEVTGTVALFRATKADRGGTLTLLHNNDGESSLLPITYDVRVGTATQKLPVGGVAAFKAVTDAETTAARKAGRSVLNVYAGDAFLASATLTCSMDRPTGAVYDAVAQRQINYDAHVIGNHEFDFTPDFLKRFITSFEKGGVLDQPFLSSNLDVSPESALAGLADAEDGLLVGESRDGKVIARSLVFTDLVTTLRVGVVGATTPLLPTISSPRKVALTSTDAATTAAVVQKEIDRLLELGITKIVFVSHLQDVANDRAVVKLLRGVDIAVAGGGDELLTRSATELLPGETAPIAGKYPVYQRAADNALVPIVTTAGNYKYLGRLVVKFDAKGRLTTVSGDSKPVRVIPAGDVAKAIGGIGDTVTPDAGLLKSVHAPVEKCLADLASTPVAVSATAIDVSRSGVRGKQSNGGNLVADSWLAAYDRYASPSGLPARGSSNPVIAIQNGGGIRQNAGDRLPAGGAGGVISRLDVINVLPFDNTLVVVQGMSAADVKAMMELSAQKVNGGGFLQIGGFDVTLNLSRPAGSRVVTLTLDDGTRVVTNGAVDPAAPATIRVVTNNFTAAGGDGYTIFAGKTITTLRSSAGLAIPYELGLREYLAAFPVASGRPTIPAGDTRYAPFPGGETRITFAP